MPVLSNPRWEMVAQHYARHGVGTRAMEHAGMAKSGAGAVLSQPVVLARVAELRKEIFGPMHMDASEALGQIARIARADIRNIFDPKTGGVLPPWEVDDDTALAITEIEEHYNKDGELVRKYKLASKLDALKTLAQHLKLIGADVQINITADLADRLERARRRVEKDITPQGPRAPELGNEGHPPVLLQSDRHPESDLVFEKNSAESELEFEKNSAESELEFEKNCMEIPGNPDLFKAKFEDIDFDDGII